MKRFLKLWWDVARTAWFLFAAGAAGCVTCFIIRPGPPRIIPFISLILCVIASLIVAIMLWPLYRDSDQ